jgi:hypothetical protein
MASRSSFSHYVTLEVGVFDAQAIRKTLFARGAEYLFVAYQSSHKVLVPVSIGQGKYGENRLE